MALIGKFSVKPGYRSTLVAKVETPYTYESPFGRGLDGEVVAVEMFYDWSMKLWTIFRVDADGNELGSAEYAVRRAEAIEEAEYMAVAR